VIAAAPSKKPLAIEFGTVALEMKVKKARAVSG